MNKDIQVIRESIGRIVSMLTQRAIKVTQRGTKAYVAYSTATGKIQSVNVPYLPDDASPDYIAAIQGFLDHEVGHVLHTDHSVVLKAARLGARVKNLHNLIEDTYIERKMSIDFRGSGSNLEAVRRYYLERVARVKINEALADGDSANAQGYGMVVAFRAWAGQTIAQDFLKSDPRYEGVIAPIQTRLGDDLIARLAKCNSSQDCLSLAIDMNGKLTSGKKEEELPPPKPVERDEEEESGPSMEDKGRTPSEDEDEPDVPESGDADEEAPGEEAPDIVDPKLSEALTRDKEEKRPEPAEPKESEADEGEKTPSGPEPEDRGDAEPEPEEPSESGEGEGEPEKPEADEGGDEEGVGADSDLPGEEGDTLESPGPSASGGMSSDDTDELGDDDDDVGSAFDEERDFDDAMSKVLSESAMKAADDADYLIYSTDWDRVEPGPMCREPDTVKKMQERVRPMVDTMQKTLERSIAAKDRKMWNPGMRRGRVAPGALFRVATGDDRVFRQRFETKAKNTAVSLVVDCSGSMRGPRIKTAAMAAFALANVLERIKVSYEVIGFTTRITPELKSGIRAEGAHVRYGRDEALYMPVFKSFSERLGTEQLARMAYPYEQGRAGGFLNQNVDGECVQIAAHRLRVQRAERKIMIVLSDGEPACPPGYGLRGHLKQVAKALPSSGIEVVGIGIQTDYVTNFYDKSIVLNDVEELPTRLIGELSKLLLAD